MKSLTKNVIAILGGVGHTHVAVAQTIAATHADIKEHQPDFMELYGVLNENLVFRAMVFESLALQIKGIYEAKKSGAGIVKLSKEKSMTAIAAKFFMAGLALGARAASVIFADGVDDHGNVNEAQWATIGPILTEATQPIQKYPPLEGESLDVYLKRIMDENFGTIENMPSPEEVVNQIMADAKPEPVTEIPSEVQAIIDAVKKQHGGDVEITPIAVAKDGKITTFPAQEGSAAKSEGVDEGPRTCGCRERLMQQTKPEVMHQIVSEFHPSYTNAMAEAIHQCCSALGITGIHSADDVLKTEHGKGLLAKQLASTQPVINTANLLVDNVIGSYNHGAPITRDDTIHVTACLLADLITYAFDQMYTQPEVKH